MKLNIAKYCHPSPYPAPPPYPTPSPLPRIFSRTDIFMKSAYKDLKVYFYLFDRAEAHIFSRIKNCVRDENGRSIILNNEPARPHLTPPAPKGF